MTDLPHLIEEANLANQELNQLRSTVTQRLVIESAEREHSEVVIGLLFFAAFGTIMGVVGTLLVEGIAWHWFVLP